MDQEKIWEYFQNHPDVADFSFNVQARYRFLARQINSGLDILNIGVGRGGLEEILLAKKVNVYCLDPSEESIKQIKARLALQDRAKIGYSQSMPFNDKSFDVVIMSEVLEHLSDDVLAKTLKEVHRVLRMGGVFIGTVPADENLLENQVVCPDCGKAFHRWGHMQSFSKKRLETILSKELSGPDIRRKHFGNWMMLNWKGKIALSLKQLSILLGVKGDQETFFFRSYKE